LDHGLKRLPVQAQLRHQQLKTSVFIFHRLQLFNRCASLTSIPPNFCFQPWNVAALVPSHGTHPPSYPRLMLLPNPNDLLFRKRLIFFSITHNWVPESG
jgi:hypothetical protein